MRILKKSKSFNGKSISRDPVLVDMLVHSSPNSSLPQGEEESASPGQASTGVDCADYFMQYLSADVSDICFDENNFLTRVMSNELDSATLIIKQVLASWSHLFGEASDIHIPESEYGLDEGSIFHQLVDGFYFEISQEIQKDIVYDLMKLAKINKDHLSATLVVDWCERLSSKYQLLPDSKFDEEVLKSTSGDALDLSSIYEKSAHISPPTTGAVEESQGMKQPDSDVIELAGLYEIATNFIAPFSTGSSPLTVPHIQVDDGMNIGDRIP
jgi:hypothetical protein